ncbi:metallophosphoesterase [Anaeromyxobacter diazotrophicus]|uniref:Metallophosphatase n=1 Tax=Anaeromyxobacter diazotrophicus TaxID=2590199 RepID=A0A7I9VHH4_9BACT|nr:metallophosphoesterase [Anaeromyxobacter diazotrophicus]GEJ55853.1 metallophosphatase [Anaeromyxobacter diazotrophicus]
MTRTPTFLLFFAVLFAVLGGMHYYLWARLVRDTGLPGRRALLVVFALAAVAVPLGMALARRLSFRATRGSLTVLFTWLGAAFLLFVALVATDLARLLWSGLRGLAAASGPELAPTDPGRRLFVARTLAGGAVLAAGAAAAGAVRSATGEPRVVELAVPLERLPRALSGFTLAQISDLHVGPTIREKHVKRVVDMTNALRPDAVVITGDLVDGSVAELRAATEHLARLRARHGVYFVTGNHEYYSGARAWLAELRRYGVTPLENARLTLGDRGPGGASFDLAGVNDWSAAPGYDGRWPALEQALEDRDPERALVLLAHQPRGVAEAAAAGVGLQLSGHTHGGQLFPWNLVVAAVYPFYKGLYRLERDGKATQIYVSCGTGYWGPPMRLGAPAEVTKLVLTT